MQMFQILIVLLLNNLLFLGLTNSIVQESCRIILILVKQKWSLGIISDLFLGLLFAVQGLIKPLSAISSDEEVTAIDWKPILFKILTGGLLAPLKLSNGKPRFPSIINVGHPLTSNVNVLTNVNVI